MFQRGSRLVSTQYTLNEASMKVKPKSYITFKLYKVAEAHTTTTAKIVLTNAVLCVLRFVMIVSIIGALRKDQA